MVVLTVVHKYEASKVTAVILESQSEDDMYDAVKAVIKQWNCSLLDIDIFMATKKIGISLKVTEQEMSNVES